MNVWQMISADYANIRELCREVLHATGGGPNSRAHLFAELRLEVERHIQTKESVLYPAFSGDPRLTGPLSKLGRDQHDIRRRLDELAATSDKNGRSWAQDFREVARMIADAFDDEERSFLPLARESLGPEETEELRRAFEREKIASLEARRWHMPEAVMPSRYGLSTGLVFGAVAGLAAVGAAVLLWRMSRHVSEGYGPLQPVERHPEPPFPLRSGRVERLDRGRSPSSPSPTRSAGTGIPQGATGTKGIGEPRAPNPGFSSANPPRAPSGLASSLQPGGTLPAGGPAASVGAIGTGGGSTGNQDSGSLGQDRR